MPFSRREITAFAALLPMGLALPRIASAATTWRVVIQNSAFNPPDLAIKRGDTVIFTNASGHHTATALDHSFDTGTLKAGESGEVTFAAAGTIPYRCEHHHSMKGTITVG